MVQPASPSRDPLAALVAGATRDFGRHPVPLVSTALEVTVIAGLAVVSARRLFRNVETDPIEATMTLPVPTDAAVFALEMRNDGRLLKAVAQSKTKARETYENAIDRGKPAALHEELLPGIHMLSVANVAPGSEIEVTIRFAMVMQAMGQEWRLRLPVTVGDVYGRSPLDPSDDLIHAPSGAVASLVVRGEGVAALVQGTLVEGSATVTLNAPVGLVVRELPARTLEGVVGGERVTLRIEAEPPQAAPLDAALLVDVSGSMNEAFDGSRGASKHQALVLGLMKAAERLGAEDRVDIYTFANDVDFVGMAGQPAGEPIGRLFQELLVNLPQPGGGTEIGRAVDTVIAESEARDIVLFTDGKSHALDVANLARRGGRIHAVLIGEDALDAHLGRLAIATGGRLHVPLCDRLGDAIAAALVLARSSSSDIVDMARHGLVARRGTVRIETAWGAPSAPAAEGEVDDLVSRAVAAVSVSLRLPHLDPASASAL